MTKQLHDLFKSFGDMTIDEQIAKIEEVRNNRNIERPAVAQRRQKKEAKRSGKRKDSLKALLAKLAEDEREQMIMKLKEGSDDT